jgi:hypothetical protein
MSDVQPPSHGDDPQEAILRLLADPEWFVRSDAHVAEHAGASCQAVAAVRRAIPFGEGAWSDTENNTPTP